MFTSWDAFTRDDINAKIWWERSEDKKQAKDKQVADGPGASKNGIKAWTVN